MLAAPYLCCLESLLLQDYALPKGVPAILAAATQLRHLQFGVMYKTEDYPIMLTDSDVDVLSTLPALTTLNLQKGYLGTSCIERAAHLEDEFLAKSRALPIIKYVLQ